MTVVIWLAILGGLVTVGRIDDTDYHDPEDFLPTRDKFQPAPADLPKGPLNG